MAETAVFPTVCEPNKNYFEVRNPFNDELVQLVEDCTVQDAENVIDTAYEALKAWRTISPRQKSSYLRNIGDLLLRDKVRLGKILSLENGKPKAEAEGEVAFSASFFHWFAGETSRNYGDIIPSPMAGKQFITVREPLGVAALVCPWNFPIGMPARKMAAALAAGCTCVLKPAEDTPLSTIELVNLTQEAGLPSGVVNIVTCSRDNVNAIGQLFSTHPKVGVLSFTGSTEVGLKLAETCATSLKRVALELGGNAPFIIFNSADLDAALNGLMASKFRNTGQTCVTANRILVQDDVYDQFLHMFTEKVKNLKIGNGSDDGVDQGPLINKRQQARVERITRESLEAGAVLHYGGQIIANGFQPTILTGVEPSMPCWKEEIFGPVAAIRKFTTEDEAIGLANDSDKGLAAFFYSRDVQQMQRVSHALEAGMVGCNDVAVSAPEAPFGGYKKSGIGKEGSRHGLDEYQNIKLIVTGGL